VGGGEERGKDWERERSSEYRNIEGTREDMGAVGGGGDEIEGSIRSVDIATKGLRPTMRLLENVEDNVIFDIKINSISLYIFWSR